MRCQTVFSHELDETKAISEFRMKISNKHLAMLICYYTEEYCCDKLQHAFKTQFPGIPFHGSSSCQAIMTEHGFHPGPVVGVFAIFDSGLSNAYGTGISVEANLPQMVDHNVQHVLEMALCHANRQNEVPSLILLHSTPGNEEEIIQVLDQYFGTLVPIIGGSAADNQIKGAWSLFTSQGTSRNGISLTVFFSSQSIYTGFSAGHIPTEVSGNATKVNGRELIEIDNRPAASVYQEWAELHFKENEKHNIIFDVATAYPLGRIAGHLYDHPYFILSHPIRETEQGGIELFSKIDEGDRLYLMRGCKEQLIRRAARVVNAAFWQKLEDSNKIGVINIFCAGSMIQIRQDIDAVLTQLADELNGQPFICPFTFGEQGRFIGGENGHGNLMISSAIFHSPYDT